MTRIAHNRVDRIGQKFGKVTIKSLEKVENKVTFWRGVCECGNETVIRQTNLKKIKSCGCSKRNYVPPDPTLPDAEGALRRLYRRYVVDAQRRKHSFSLSLEEFKVIVNSDCYYCGIAPFAIQKSYAGKADDLTYNGIDRVCNEIGYDIANVVPCCKNCNYAKRKFTQEEFFNMIERIYNKWHKPL